MPDCPNELIEDGAEKGSDPKEAHAPQYFLKNKDYVLLKSKSREI